MNGHKDLLIKWLTYLLYLHVASLVLAVINSVAGQGSFTQWISWAVSIGAIVCMYRLREVNPRYQKAALFQGISLGGSLLVTLGGGLGLLGTVASVCGIVATYQEYHGHSELVAGTDERLSRQWSGLFLWSLVLGLISGFVSTAAVTIGVLAQADTALLTTLAVALVLLAGAVVEVLYLRYMNRTLRLLGKIYA